MALPGFMVARHIERYGSLDEQAQPAGFDLRVGEVMVPRGEGVLGVGERSIPEYAELSPEDGWWHLRPGAYIVRFMEIVSIPGNAVGICLPRSSLLRMGATLSCAVWDPGYRGRGLALLQVYNLHGIRLERGARVAQMVFIKTTMLPRRLYGGVYQGEGIGGSRG